MPSEAISVGVPILLGAEFGRLFHKGLPEGLPQFPRCRTALRHILSPQNSTDLTKSRSVAFSHEWLQVEECKAAQEGLAARESSRAIQLPFMNSLHGALCRGQRAAMPDHTYCLADKSLIKTPAYIWIGR